MEHALKFLCAEVGNKKTSLDNWKPVFQCQKISVMLRFLEMKLLNLDGFENTALYTHFS